MAVFVLDKRKRPLMPCTEKRARLLLQRKRARVHQLHPFTIRLIDRTREASQLQSLRLKLDPGSKITGMAITRETRLGQGVLHLAELVHRGERIRKALKQRHDCRHGRRSRNLRYRPKRINNRRRPVGWLAPSLQHRVDTVLTWVDRYRKLAPITRITAERVRFDTQALVSPEIAGVRYQQGTLAGYEIREYLLEKFGRRCVYCGKTDLPLQVEHLIPKSRGGSDRVSNLALACETCNLDKGNKTVHEYLVEQPKKLTELLEQAQAPLKDAAAVNSTRWAIWERIVKTGLPLEATTGGRTKWNRHRLGIPKTHALDAACAGDFGVLQRWERPVLRIKCTGRGSHQRTRVTKDGFPRGYLPRTKTVQGFRTGDVVKAVVPKGKHAGTYTGRVAVRATGSFNIQTARGTVQGIPARHCRLLRRADGYGYAMSAARPSSLGLSRGCPDLDGGAAVCED
jgi:5-methylcytosine-specific restriction endonuclease McrA